MGQHLTIRHCTVTTMASFTERDFWLAAAKERKLSLSDWVREVLNHEVKLDGTN